MSFATFAFVLTLAGFGVSAPTSGNFCENFNLGKRFSNNTLVGTIWKTFPAEQQQPEEFELDPFLGARYSWFYNLTQNEIKDYSEVMAEDFPDVSWNNVIYSWNFDSHVHLPNFKYGPKGSFKFLIEVKENSFGDVAAIPVGDTYTYMKTIGSKLTTPTYRIREVENSLAVMFCERDHKYLLTRVFQRPKQQVIKSVFPSIG